MNLGANFVHPPAPNQTGQGVLEARSDSDESACIPCSWVVIVLPYLRVANGLGLEFIVGRSSI